MNLAFTRSRYQYYSEKASDRVRQLGLAGIALIWVFKQGGDRDWQVPRDLLPAGLLFVLSLAFDFLQYAVGSIIWSAYNRYKEFEDTKEDVDFQAPDAINWPCLALFWAKIALLGWGYWLMIEFLRRRIWG